MSTAELELVMSMLEGDESAFEAFFDAYFPALFRFAVARTGSEDAAEEIVQTTMTTAIRKIGTWRGEASLFTWLCTICRHEISAHRERGGVRILPLIEDDPAIAAALASLADDGQEAVVARGETTRLVHVVLDLLPPRYASALEWKYIDGISVKEIADRLQLTAKAAESLLTRARDAFREGFAIVTQGEKA